jgi:hypothetical protein
VVKNERGSCVEAKCGRPAKYLWLAIHLPPLFPSFPSTIFFFVSTTAPHGLATRPPTLAGQPHLGSTIKGLPMGASSFIP